MVKSEREGPTKGPKTRPQPTGPTTRQAQKGHTEHGPQNEPGPNGPQSGKQKRSKAAAKAATTEARRANRGGPRNGAQERDGNKRQTAKQQSSALKRKAFTSFMRVRDEQATSVLSSCFVPAYYFAKPSSHPSSRCEPSSYAASGRAPTYEEESCETENQMSHHLSLSCMP